MSKSSKQTQTTQKPQWLREGSQQAVDIAQRIAERPYTPYEDQRIADLSEAERLAGERAMTMGQDYQTDLSRARELTEQGAGSFLEADMEGYMSPYIKGALDPAAREIREQMLREQEAIKGQAGMVGAFGGGRQAIVESEARRGGLEAVGDLYGRGYQQAFESARDQFNVDRDAFARGAEQFRATGAQGQQQLTQDIQNLLTTGGLKRSLEQAGLDFDYQQFIEERDWDVQNLDTLVRTLSAVPAGETVTQEKKKSAFSTILGVAATAAAAYFTGGTSLALQAGAGAAAKAYAGGGEGGGGGGSWNPMPSGGTGAGGGYQPPVFAPGSPEPGFPDQPWATPPIMPPVSAYRRAV